MQLVRLDDPGPQMSRQLELPFHPEGEARKRERSGEGLSVVAKTADPGMVPVMEDVLERGNLMAALKRVRRNKGSAGVDGMTVTELGPWLKENWRGLRKELLAGSYSPQPVLQKLLKSEGGKVRMLGIPTVVDRLIQQAMLQKLQPLYDPDFSEHSHGFRPGRSAHGALLEARDHVRSGRTWVVDVDLSKFFDRVNHDILMSRLARRLKDRRLLRLIRGFLTAGMMVDGVEQSRVEGTPQGGPLSPLLANILLDEVDKELERRGHAFVRYADDSRVFVRSERAGTRVMGILRRLYGRLKLVLNEEKSAVAHYQERAFLGYVLLEGRHVDVGFAPSKESEKRLKTTVRQVTGRMVGWRVQQVIDWLKPRLLGWREYFKLTTHFISLRNLEGWIRRRLRALQLSQWKNCRTIARRLRVLGASEKMVARVTAFHGRWWHAAGAPSNSVLTNRFFDKLGLPRLVT